MNRTNWEHVAVALAHQIVIGIIFGNWWAGAALGAGSGNCNSFCLGRTSIGKNHATLQITG